MNKRTKPLKAVPERDWPESSRKPNLTNVYLSRDFLVQQYIEDNNIIRLSVNRTKRSGNNWKDGITWDELQHIKNECGFKDKCAVEVYPEQSNVVNVANIRHLFILPERPAFAWRK